MSPTSRARASTAAPACKIALVAGGDVDGFERIEDVIDAESGEPLPDPAAGSTMLYTSGTTGRPKGVHRPPTAAAALTIGLGGYDEAGGDVHLCTGPLYHAAPLAFSLRGPAVVRRHGGAHGRLGCRSARCNSSTNTASRTPTWSRRCSTACSRSPTTCVPASDVSSLKYVLHGAAPCPVPVKRRIIEWFGPIVWEYYAATEGVGSFVDSATWLEHPGTVGKPYLPDQVMIGDADGNPLPTGEVGLVYLQGAASHSVLVLQGRREDRVDVPRRLLHPRRRRLPRRRGLPVPHRPEREPHHLGRRQHLPGRGRRGAARASGCRATSP